MAEQDAGATTTPITVITGGSRGIGAATARLCAAAGHAVCVAYRADAEAAGTVQREIEEFGGRALAVQVDTRSEADIVRLFETVDRDLGRLTGLVNNAGIFGPRGRVDELASEALSDLLAVNVAGYFLCAREAIRRMSKQQGGGGGAIVNVSGIASRRGNPGTSVLYASSKGAINTLTIGLAQEVAGEGIRVSAVSPGLVDTTMNPPERIASAGDFVPIGRAAAAEEVGQTILWLLSNDASYVAGANVEVAGGLR